MITKDIITLLSTFEYNDNCATQFIQTFLIADSKISHCSNDSEILDWIYKLMDFQIDQIWYIWLNGFLVRIQILNIKAAIMGLWNNIDSRHKHFVLINENRNMMYEFGSDSRDEYNYLFDKYLLV